jgi:hypothetical protein
VQLEIYETVRKTNPSVLSLNKSENLSIPLRGSAPLYTGQEEKGERIMNEVRELYTLKEGKAFFRECVIPTTNRHLFEVKDQDQVLYQGESYRHAKALYEELCQG